MLQVEPSGQACGAMVTGVDLSQPLSEAVVREMRDAWLEHHVVCYPDQHLNDADLVRITQAFGEVGDDPFFESISPDNPVFALTRRADEQAPVFAENWHSDWSFKQYPPIGSCLYSIEIPPVGGDTGFANQHLAAANLPVHLREKLAGKRGIHSAALAYAPDGTYGEHDHESDRSMKIITNDSARDKFVHDIIAAHPENGKETIFSTYGYIMGIEGMDQEEAAALLIELYHHQCKEEFQYRHKWSENMFVMWDNRSVLHRAYGGYDGYARELHRTTIAGSQEFSIS